MSVATKGFFKEHLPNGIRALVEPVSGVRSVAVGIWVECGSRHEAPSEAGVSHFIEHMIFKGTRRRTALEIAKAFDRMGGFSNAFTGREQTCFHAKVLDENLSAVMELLADMFLESQFDPEELQRERMVILQEISMVEDSPDDLVHDLFYRHFWPGSGLGRPILGTLETVNRFERDDLLAYMACHYTPGRVVLAAAGNVEPRRFFGEVERWFGGMEPGEALAHQPAPAPVRGVWHHPRELEQLHMVVGFEALPASSPQRFAITLLNVILGGSMSSRLFQEVREKRGLAYSIYSFNSAYLDTGLLGVYAGVDPSNVEPTVSIICNELASLAQKGPEADELAAAKEHVKGGLLLSAENSDSRMSRLAKMELYLHDYMDYDEVVAAIEAVTEEEVARVASACLEQGGAAALLGELADGPLSAVSSLLHAEVQPVERDQG